LGAYTNDKWSSRGDSIKGVGTFIFSVDLKRTFPQLRKESIFCSKLCGPSFGENNLMVGLANKMNNEDESSCSTVGFDDLCQFSIPTDNNGNNIVTGEGSRQKDYDKKFTCIDLEVYSVTY
jgi:hypothetical protein